jgi:hypothetical protein
VGLLLGDKLATIIRGDVGGLVGGSVGEQVGGQVKDIPMCLPSIVPVSPRNRLWRR